MMIRAAFALLAVVFGTLPAPAAADQKDPRLAPLFEKLEGSGTVAEAQMLELLAGALELFDAITLGRPDFAEGWNKRATVLYMLGAHERSAEDVAKVLALEPRHFGALSGLGLINMELERPDAAIEAFERALKVHPHLPGVKQRVEMLRKKKRDGNI
jgi:tetratricopeptide (TPR) repeat protein